MQFIFYHRSAERAAELCIRIWKDSMRYEVGGVKGIILEITVDTAVHVIRTRARDCLDLTPA